MKLASLTLISVFSLLVEAVPRTALAVTGLGFYRVRVLQEEPLSTGWVELKGISASTQRYLLEYARGQQPVRTRNKELLSRIQDAKILRVEYCREEGQCLRISGLYAGRAPF